MGNDFTFIGKDNQTPEDIAYRLGRLSEDLRDVVVAEDAKKQVREVLQDPVTSKVLGPERIQGIWTDVRKLEGVSDIRDYLMNVSRFVEKEGRAKESWSNLAQYLGKADASTQTEDSKGDGELYFELLYPEKRIVNATQILSWAKDLEADGKIDGGFGEDVYAAIEQLEDAGVITVGNRGKPISTVGGSVDMDEPTSEDSSREASVEELVARIVVLAQDIAASPVTKAAAVLKAIKFFNEPSVKTAFGQSRINWIHQDMRNAGDAEGVVQTLRNLVAQLEKEGLPTPTESVIGAMAPAGGARTMGWGESFEVKQGMYEGLRGTVKKWGRFVETEVQETWKGKLNGLPVEIMEGSVIHIPSIDVVPEAVAASKVDINWKEAEEELNSFLSKQTRTVFSLPEFLDLAKKEFAKYSLEIQDLDTSEPAGEKSLNVKYDGEDIEDTHLDIRWMTKDGEAHIDSSVHFPESENAEKEEELDSEIYLKLEDMIEKMANSHAAEAWSTPSDETTDKHGEDVWVKAEFGDSVAVNGDLVGDNDNSNPPDGFEQTDDGGRIPTVEEEVSLEHAIQAVANEMKLDYERVEKVARKDNQKDLVYTSVSGEAEVWAKPKTDESAGDESVPVDTKTLKALQQKLRDWTVNVYSPELDTFVQNIKDEFAHYGMEVRGLESPRGEVIPEKNYNTALPIYKDGKKVANAGFNFNYYQMPSGSFENTSYIWFDRPEGGSESATLDKKIKREINTFIHDGTFNKYFRDENEFLRTIEEELAKYNIDIEMNQSQKSATGSVQNTFKLFMGDVEINNSMLIYSTYKMHSGKWEITAYLS